MVIDPNSATENTKFTAITGFWFVDIILLITAMLLIYVAIKFAVVGVHNILIKAQGYITDRPIDPASTSTSSGGTGSSSSTSSSGTGSGSSGNNASPRPLKFWAFKLGILLRTIVVLIITAIIVYIIWMSYPHVSGWYKELKFPKIPDSWRRRTVEIPTDTHLGDIISTNEVLQRLSNAFDIPISELDQVLKKSEGGAAPGQNFAIAMNARYGIVLPSNLDDVPATPSDIKPYHIPNGLRLKIVLRKIVWSRPLHNVDWITTWQEPPGFSDRIEYLFDGNTDHAMRVMRDSQNRRRILNSDGTMGDVLPDDSRGGGVTTVQARLPRNYKQNVDSVTFTLIRKRTR